MMRSKFHPIAIFLTVLAASPVQGQSREFLVAPDDAPVYVISKLREEPNRLGKNVFAFDFRRTRQGSGAVGVMARSGSQYFPISASIPESDESGAIRLIHYFLSDSVDGLELFLTQHKRWIDGSSKTFILSNVLSKGVPDRETTARAWTDQERIQYADLKRIMSDDAAHKPPRTAVVTIQPPEGFEFLPNDAIVVPKTKLKCCFANDWQTLTCLSQNADGSVNVRWEKYGPGNDCSMKRDQLLIDTETLQALARDPSIENIPVRLPNGLPKAGTKNLRLRNFVVRIPVPTGWTLVPEGVQIPEGTVLRGCYANKWNSITPLQCNDDGTVSVRWDRFPSTFNCKMIRSELIVSKADLAAWGVDIPESSRAKTDSSNRLTAPDVRKSYPISVRVPTEYVFIPNNLRVRNGTRIYAYWQSKWNPVTALSNNSDGTLNVHWDGFPDVFDCSMLRKELIIRRTLLDQMNLGPLEGELRTWTDATGRLKVSANFVSQNGSTAFFLTESGEPKVIPIAKLSGSDRKFLMDLANDPVDAVE